MSANTPTFHTESGSAAFDMDIPEPTTVSNGPDMFVDLPTDQQPPSPIDKPESVKKEAISDLSDKELPQTEDEKQETTKEKSIFKPKGKTVKLLDSEGKVIEISPDVQLDVIIDGKKVKASLNELKSNYSGKVVYEKKYQELDSERKLYKREKQDWEGKRTALNERINEFYKLATVEKKPVEALQYLVGMSGLNQADFFKNLQSKMYADAYDYFTKNPEERKQIDFDQEMAYKRSEQQMLDRQVREQAAQLKYNQEKYHFMQQAGMTENQFDEIRDQFVEKGIDPKELHPETVARVHVKGMMYREIGDILKKVDPKLPQNFEIVEDVFKMRLENPTLTDGDLYEVVKEAYRKNRARNLSRKVNQSAVPVITTTKAPTVKQKQETKEELFF